MGEADPSIRRFYAGWDTYNDRIVEVVRDMSIERCLDRWTPDMLAETFGQAVLPRPLDAD